MWLTVGYDRAIASLVRGLQEGRISHAYLLVGPPQAGKMTLALDLARAVNCLADDRPCGECGQCQRVDAGLHADVRVLGVDGETTAEGRSRVAIGIDQVRTMQREASLKPYEGRYRVFIVDGAELLSDEAANSLLKFLEEPPDQVVLVLLASDSGSLLPTVVSRCQRLPLRRLPLERVTREIEERFGLSRAEAEETARLSNGRMGRAFELAGRSELREGRAERLAAIEEAVQESLDRRFSRAEKMAAAFMRERRAIQDELELWLEWWRDAMLVKEGVPGLVVNQSRAPQLTAAAQAFSAAQIVGAVRSIQRTLEYLNQNVNPRLALEGMMLNLPGVSTLEAG